MVRLNIKNSPNGLLFEKSSKDERGHVKKGGWGIKISIDSHKLNRKSLINFINSRLEPFESKLKKGFFSVSNKQIRVALNAVLKEKAEPLIDPSVDTRKPEEKPFIEKISPRQRALYQSLKRPKEKQLYQQLYLLGNSDGIFGDLLLSLIKDRVLDFQIHDNDITLELIKGSAHRKLLGFELKGTFPDRLTLHYDQEIKKLSFVNGKIPFTLSFFDIFSPKAITLTDQGALIQADFGSVAKSRDEVKQLEKPLNNEQVFKLFE